MTVIDESTPLQQDHLPEEIIDRDTETEFLSTSPGSENLHIHGPRGTGKSHLVEKSLAGSDLQTCYVSCVEHDTQYKVLQQLVSSLAREPVDDGLHSSDLQRRFEDHVEVLDIAVVLDDLDLLLLNDGDDLLYFLSRLENGPKIICITANTEELRDRVEPRTYSSLQPRRIQFEPYTGEQIFRILKSRASRSIQPRSVHRNAATYIASATQNAEIALTWLRTAAQNAENAVTEEFVRNVRDDAYQVYIEDKLSKLTKQHKILYQAVEELSREKGPVVNTGDIYNRYRMITSERDEDRLSDRRISDYLKQLEEFGLISVEYHYGGSKGKTREVQLSYLQ